MQSETIGQLAQALAKAQGNLKNATKSAENPFFRSKYADLATVIDTIRSVLSDNNLSYTQVPEVDENGSFVLITTLMHKSGEWINGKYPIMPTKEDPQGYGSAISYARRYSLSALVGIAQEDDDGNAASQPAPATVKIPQKQQKEFAAQVRTCLESADEQGLKELWSEWESEEKAMLWKLFSAGERSTMKDLMK